EGHRQSHSRRGAVRRQLRPRGGVHRQQRLGLAVRLLFLSGQARGYDGGGAVLGARAGQHRQGLHAPDVSCGSGDGGLILPPPPDSGIACTTYCTLDAGVNAAPSTQYGPDGQPLSSGTLMSAMPANACGNQYWVVVEVTNDWRFYTIPFARFSQQRQPNLVGTPNGLFSPGTTPGTTIVTSTINNMTFRFPKESAQDLWIDRLSFYRPGVGDGGTGQ